MANAASMLQKLSSYSLKREEDLPRIKEQCDELIAVAGQLSGEQLRKIQEIKDQAHANMERLQRAPGLWLEATRTCLEPKGDAHLPWRDLQIMSEGFQELFSKAVVRTQLISLSNEAFNRLRERLVQQIRVRLDPVSYFSCLACCLPSWISVQYEFTICSSKGPAYLLEEWLSKSNGSLEDIQSRLTLPSPAAPPSQAPQGAEPSAFPESQNDVQQEEEEYVEVVPPSNSQNYRKLLEDEEI